MQIVNIILVLILVLAIVGPFIIIPIILLYNHIINSLQNKLKKKVSARTAEVFTAWFIFGPLLKSASRWKKLIETFNRINESSEVSEEIKKRLYDAYKNRGCNPLAK